MNIINNKLPLPGEIYTHYKGGTYEIVSMATHTETGEKLVVYKSINFGSVYVRPYSIFSDKVETKNDFGKLVINRFEKQSNLFF
jgi:hypothetical protein